MRFTIREIAAATGGKVLAGRPRGTSGPPAMRIGTDSRLIEPGDAFLALRGERFDGHDFLADAARRGAACLVADTVDSLGDGLATAAVVLVDDTMQALQDLGRAARKRLECPVVAVTGSCGKTTLKEMIGQVLGRRLKGRLPPKSFNNQVGVPLTLLGAEPEDAFVVCEFGSNAPGEIAALAAVAEPTIGLVTLVAPAHLEGLVSLEGVAHEKSALPEALSKEGVAVLNADDRYVAAMAAKCRARVVTFGMVGEADYRVRDVVQTEEGLRFSVNGVKFFLPVLGAHQALLAAGAAAVAAEFGLALQDVAEALEHFTPPPMRMALERAGDVLVLNDAHNANPESMAAALDLLALWPERRKVFFCGDMKELGRAAPAAHDALGRSVAAAGVGRLVCVGELAARVGRAAERAGLAADAISTLADAAEAAAEAAGIVRPGDLVLVKGSRVMGMERIATVLQAQGAASPGS